VNSVINNENTWRPRTDADAMPGAHSLHDDPTHLNTVFHAKVPRIPGRIELFRQIQD